MCCENDGNPKHQVLENERNPMDEGFSSPMGSSYIKRLHLLFQKKWKRTDKSKYKTGGRWWNTAIHCYRICSIWMFLYLTFWERMVKFYFLTAHVSFISFI